MGISLVEGAGFSIHYYVVTDHMVHVFMIVKSSGVYDGKVCADFVCTRHTSIVHE